MTPSMIVTAIVLTAGTPCPEVRTDDGRVLQTIGLPNTVKPGERLRLTGEMRFSFSCQREVLAVTQSEPMN